MSRRPTQDSYLIDLMPGSIDSMKTFVCNTIWSALEASRRQYGARPTMRVSTISASSALPTLLSSSAAGRPCAKAEAN